MINVFLSGLTSGAIYAALVLGVVLVYRFAHAINFAHGAVATLASYCAYQVLVSGGPYWLGAVVAILVGIAVNSVLGWMMTKFFLGASEIVSTMASMGPMLALIGLVGIFWGQQTKSLPLPGIPTKAVAIGNYHVSAVGLAVLALIAVVIIVLVVLLRWTRYGVLLRAASDSRALAALSGLRVVGLERTIWAVGGALAACAGLLIVPQVSLLPQSLTDLLIVSLAAAALGGMSSLGGLIVGGFVYGVTVAFTQYFFQLQLNSILALLVLLIVFAVRPEGLLGRRAGKVATFFPESVESAAGGRRRTRVGNDGSIYRKLSTAATSRLSALSARSGWWSNIRRHYLLTAVLISVVCIVLTPYLLSAQVVFALTSVALLAIAIAGQNVLSGLSGILFLAQGGLMLFASYVAAVFSVRFGFSMVEGLVAGVLAGIVAAAVLKLSVARIGGFYVAMVTLLFSLAVPEVVLAFDSVTGGSGGLFTSGLVIAGSPVTGVVVPFRICASLAVAALVLVTIFKRAHIGLLCRAVRDSKRGAESIGINPELPLFAAVCLAGACAGLAGAVSAFQVGVVTPDSFGVLTSIYILLAAAIGGSESTYFGPVLGGVFIVGLPYVLGGSGSVSNIVFGVALVAVLSVRVALTKESRRGRGTPSDTSEGPGEYGLPAPAVAAGR